MENCNKDEKFRNMTEKVNKNHAKAPEKARPRVKLSTSLIAKTKGYSKHKVCMADKNFTR